MKKKLEKEKKKVKKADKFLKEKMEQQERLMDIVRRQNEKNERLEKHLLRGGSKKDPTQGLMPGDADYDPLDDLSFDDDDLEKVFTERPKPKKKTKKKPVDK